MRIKIFTGVLAITMLVLPSCKKEKENLTTVFVSTSEITNVTTTTATGTGDVDLVGMDAISERGFVWAITPKPTIDNNKVLAAGTGTGNFTAELTGLPQGTTYYVRAYVINNGQPFYGNEVKPQIELIVNGNFSLPSDASIVDVNAIANWKTDETSANVGRKTDYWDPNNFILETNDWSKSVYQEIGTVPSIASEYAINFDRNWYWTDWGDYYSTIVVIFSAYSGTDPKTRVPVGTVTFKEPEFFPGWANNWVKKSGSFSLPANSPHAGEKLVVEIDVLPYDDGSSGWDPNNWYHIDNLSVLYKP